MIKKRIYQHCTRQSYQTIKRNKRPKTALEKEYSVNGDQHALAFITQTNGKPYITMYRSVLAQKRETIT